MTASFNSDTVSLVSADDILENCVMAIICPLSKFYPDKNFGNRIRKSIDCGELLASARQAVRNIDGVFIKNMCINNGMAEFTIMINDEERRVSIGIE